MGLAERTRVLVAIAVVLLALPGISHAQTVCGMGQSPSLNSCSCPFGSDVKNGACVPDMFLNAANAALVIMFSLLGIMYMLARAVDSPRLTNFVNGEIYQTIGTAVILLFCWSMVTLLNSVVAPLVYNSSIISPVYSGAGTGRVSCAGQSMDGSWASAQTHVQCYLNTVMGDAQNSIREFVGLAGVAGAVGSASYSLQILVAYLYVTPYSVFGSLTNVIAAVLGFIVAAITMLEIQIQLVNFANALFFILLPMGVIFRSFTFTRGLGNSMIAVSIGFMVILPAMYLVLEDVSMYYYTNPVVGCGGRPSASGQLFSLVGSGFSIGSGGANNIISSIEAQFQVGSKFSCLAFLLVMESTIFPLIGYTFALGITKRLAEILGSPIDFSSIVRFV